jgi:hypothetical protein
MYSKKAEGCALAHVFLAGAQALEGDERQALKWSVQYFGFAKRSKSHNGIMP